MSEHKQADFARTCFNRNGGITLSVVCDGQSPKWDLSEDSFWVLAESVAQTAKDMAQSRRMYIASGRPAVADEFQPPCDA